MPTGVYERTDANRKYNEEMKEYALSIYSHDKTYEQLAQEFSAKYNVKVNGEAIRSVYRRIEKDRGISILKGKLKVINGGGKLEKARKASGKGQRAELGTIRIIRFKNHKKKHHFYEINVGYKQWRRLTNVRYEEYHNCRVDDKKQIVVQLNRNIDDFSKENLLLISQETFRVYNAKYRNKFNGEEEPREFKNPYYRKLAYLSLELNQRLKENKKNE